MKLLALSCLSLAVFGSANADTNWTWYEKDALPSYGRGFKDVDNYYCRLPKRAWNVVRGPIWNMAHDSTGMFLRFKPFAKRIRVEWKVENEQPYDPLIPEGGMIGIDVYRWVGHGWSRTGAYRYWGNHKRLKEPGVAEFDWREGEPCQICLPIRARNLTIRVGVPEGGRIEKFPFPAGHEKPVVHYGTSIVHGGCASRPGLVYSSLAQRELDRDYINLGFSGNGKMEIELAPFLAEIDAAVYVVDCSWNMTPELIATNGVPFLEKLKALKPETPILLCDGCNSKASEMPRNVAMRKVYETLKDGDPVKWRNLYYFSENEMLTRGDLELTHDFCHPNDLGTRQLGKAYARRIREVLSAETPAIVPPPAATAEMDGIRFLGSVTKVFRADEQWRFAREPQLARLPDGTLYCALFSGGPREPAPENVVIAVRSTDDGRTWSKPEVVVSHPARACWATELFTFGEEPELVFQTYCADRTYTELRPYRMRLGKDGKRTVDATSFHGVPPNFSVRQGKVLSDGSWAFPVYWLENTGSWLAHLEYPPQGDVDWSKWNWKKWHYVSGVIRSVDKGKTWTVHGSLGDGATHQAWEPCLTELEPGHLRLWARVANGVLWSADSRDYGVTWSELKPSDIPNPDTKPMVLRHGNDIVLVNNVPGKEGRDRRRLEIWVSHDFCKTWKTFVAAERKDGGAAFLCYPSGFFDDAKKLFYLAVDGCGSQYLTRIPFSAIGLE